MANETKPIVIRIVVEVEVKPITTPVKQPKKRKTYKHIKVGEVYNMLTVVAPANRNSGSGRKYWVCECECGTVKEILSNNLRTGATKSCGCFAEGMPSKVRLPDNHSDVTDIIAAYKVRARNNSREFSLTREQVVGLIAQPCYYCGAIPSNETKRGNRKPLLYNGLDRRDNNAGYTIDNVVPCCKSCNCKKHTMEENVFVLALRAAKQN